MEIIAVNRRYYFATFLRQELIGYAINGIDFGRKVAIVRHKFFVKDRVVRAISVTKFSLLAIFLAMPQNANAFEPYEDSAGQVVLLANEKNEPFLFFGKKVRGSEFEAEYSSSLKRFPSVINCLLASEKNKKTPDLIKLDWEEIDTNEDAEVCLFRVASSYENSISIRNWLKLQGFKVYSYIPPVYNEELVIRASWSIKKNGTKFSSNFLERIWINLIAYGLSVGFDYDQKSKKIEHVSITLSIL